MKRVIGLLCALIIGIAPVAVSVEPIGTGYDCFETPPVGDLGGGYDCIEVK